MDRNQILTKAKEICAPGQHYNSKDNKLHVNHLADGGVAIYYLNGNGKDEMMFLSLLAQLNGHGGGKKYIDEIQLCKPGYWQTALERVRRKK